MHVASICSCACEEEEEEEKGVSEGSERGGLRARARYGEVVEFLLTKQRKNVTSNERMWVRRQSMLSRGAAFGRTAPAEATSTKRALALGLVSAARTIRWPENPPPLLPPFFAPPPHFFISSPPPEMGARSRFSRPSGLAICSRWRPRLPALQSNLWSHDAWKQGRGRRFLSL